MAWTCVLFPCLWFVSFPFGKVEEECCRDLKSSQSLQNSWKSGRSPWFQTFVQLLDRSLQHLNGSLGRASDFVVAVCCLRKVSGCFVSDIEEGPCLFLSSNVWLHAGMVSLLVCAERWQVCVEFRMLRKAWNLLRWWWYWGNYFFTKQVLEKGAWISVLQCLFCAFRLVLLVMLRSKIISFRVSIFDWLTGLHGPVSVQEGVRGWEYFWVASGIAWPVNGSSL